MSSEASIEVGTPATTASTPASTPDDSGNALKRGRKSRPKVKTGCTNCKLRRIKCDERRPACAQCLRSQKQCSGYPPPSRHAAPYLALRIAPKPAGVAPIARGSGPLARETILPPRRLNRRLQYHQYHQWAATPASLAKAPSPATATPSPTLYRPSANIPLQSVEVPYFDLFRARTASELSGYFNTVFWTQRVLQECHFEPAIRHAAVALGALYKALEQVVVSSRADMAMPHRHWQVAVRQYSEACKVMMLLDDQSQHSNRTRLMASVLLSSFDAFIGDHKQAIVQIRSGLGLLDRLRVEQARSGSPEPVEEEFIAIFTRLFIQAKSYDMAFHFPEPYVIRLDSTDASVPGPERLFMSSSAVSLDVPFSTLQEARLAYDHLLEKSLGLIERMHLIQKQPYPLFPASWHQHGLGFQDELRRWTQAFQPLFEARLSPSNNLSPHERSGIAALQMLQLNSAILFRSLFNTAESQFDAFLPQFQEIVDLGYEIVPGNERLAAAERCSHPEESCPHRPRNGPGNITDGGLVAHHIRPSFSSDLGIVAPLFVVITKCREPHTRRRAIRLLRSSARREGMWDSELAARIGQWIMDLEESDGDEASVDGMAHGTVGGGHAGIPYKWPPSKPIPEERRVMVYSVDFDLRARFAHLQVGARAATANPAETDPRRRETYISW